MKKTLSKGVVVTVAFALHASDDTDLIGHQQLKLRSRFQLLELLFTNSSGSLVKSGSQLLVSSSVPNEALRSYHQQMLAKATSALRTQTPQEKLIGSETFAFDEKHLKEASGIIEECSSKLVKLAKSKRSKRDVYHLGIQFFKLTKRQGSNEN